MGPPWRGRTSPPSRMAASSRYRGVRFPPPPPGPSAGAGRPRMRGTRGAPPPPAGTFHSAAAPPPPTWAWRGAACCSLLGLPPPPAVPLPPGPAAPRSIASLEIAMALLSLSPQALVPSTGGVPCVCAGRGLLMRAPRQQSLAEKDGSSRHVLFPLQVGVKGLAVAKYLSL